MLDIMLCLHAEHGGGNNSSFTTHVLSSADTDPYSTYAAAFGSLKGHRHGGANHQAVSYTHLDVYKRQPSPRTNGPCRRCVTRRCVGSGPFLFPALSSMRAAKRKYKGCTKR